MIKQVFGKKLSRGRASREALFASLTRAMIISGKIVTTKAKAKAVQRDIEKVVTLSKKATVQARRKVLAMLDNAKTETDKLFREVAKSFDKKTSGFTRIINLKPRKGDNAKMARIEWTAVADSKKQTADGEKTKNKKPIR